MIANRAYNPPVDDPSVASSRDLRLALASALGAFLLLTCIFARLMDAEIRRDEFLYAPPAVLLDDFALYRDIFYNHMPGSAWLFHAIAPVTGPDDVLMPARLGVFLGWCLLLLGGGAAIRVLTGSWLMAWLSALLLATNDVLLGPTGMAATNNLLACAFGTVGVLVFLCALRTDRPVPGLLFLAGLLLSAATAMKASAIAFVIPPAVTVFIAPAHLSLAQRLRRCALPLALGGILAAVPVLLVIARDPSGFFAHVLGYFTGPHAAYWRLNDGIEEDVAIALPDRVRLWLLITNTASIGIGAFLLVYLASLAGAARGPKALARDLARLPVAPVLLTLVLALLVGFAPKPAFPQYFAASLTLLPVLTACLHTLIPDRRSAQIVLAAACATLLFFGAPRLLEPLPSLLHPGSWTAARADRDGRAIARIIADHGLEGAVATLNPIYPLEGGLAVYPELATGPFAYRVADLTAPELLAHYRTTSPDRIEALLEAEPPMALLLGFDDALEAPMARFAAARGYRAVPDFAIKDRYGVGRLYIRPDN